MSEHAVTVEWRRETPDFAYETYNRDHDWIFDSSLRVRASANPVYLGSENCVDPEEAFVASLSSCHMLTFLGAGGQETLRGGWLPGSGGRHPGQGFDGEAGHDEGRPAAQGRLQRSESAERRGDPAAPRTGPSGLLHR